MEIYVVRHGRVPSNDKKIIGGRGDEELTEVGIQQAESVRDKLQNVNFDVIFSSNVRRAVQTAEIINIHGLDINLDERLAEREPGEALGKSRKDIDKAIWNSLSLDRTPEGAETLKAGIVRVKSILDEIHSKYKGKKVLIVTHNFICKCIWMLENNITDPGQINDFFQENDEIKKYVIPERVVDKREEREERE